MEEWDALYSSKGQTMSIGDIETLLSAKKRKQNRHPSSLSNNAKKGRHVAWKPNQYTLLRSGTPVSSTKDIDILYNQDAITENLFHLFKNTDDSLQSERDDTIPLYEAVYYVLTPSPLYIRVQKKHLQMAYSKMDRADKSKMWDILEDGTPYWVDRYIFTKLGQRDSKRRYEEKQKKTK